MYKKYLAVNVYHFLTLVIIAIYIIIYSNIIKELLWFSTVD